MREPELPPEPERTPRLPPLPEMPKLPPLPRLPPQLEWSGVKYEELKAKNEELKAKNEELQSMLDAMYAQERRDMDEIDKNKSEIANLKKQLLEADRAE
jgi:malate synthase